MSKTISKILTAILIVALLSGIVAISVVFLRETDGSEVIDKGGVTVKGDTSTFVVEHDGKSLSEVETGLNFAEGSESRFSIRYSGVWESFKRNFSVKVIPNSKNNFRFIVHAEEDKIVSWSDVSELTEVFNLVKDEAGFFLSVPSSARVRDVLASVYGVSASSIEIAEAKLQSWATHGEDDIAFYTLVVISDGGSVEYNVDFSVSCSYTVMAELFYSYSGIEQVFPAGSVSFYPNEYSPPVETFTARAGETVSFEFQLNRMYMNFKNEWSVRAFVDGVTISVKTLSFELDSGASGYASFVMPATDVIVRFVAG